MFEAKVETFPPRSMRGLLRRGSFNETLEMPRPPRGRLLGWIKKVIASRSRSETWPTSTNS